MYMCGWQIKVKINLKWATVGLKNSFTAPWHRFYKSLDHEHYFSKRFGVLQMMVESAVKHVRPKSPTEVQLFWDLSVKSIAYQSHHFHTHQTVQWPLVSCYVSFIHIFPWLVTCQYIVTCVDDNDGDTCLSFVSISGVHSNLWLQAGLNSNFTFGFFLNRRVNNWPMYEYSSRIQTLCLIHDCLHLSFWIHPLGVLQIQSIQMILDWECVINLACLLETSSWESVQVGY